jgi:hypothetical protein
MLMLHKNDIQMTTDFEVKAVRCALLLRSLIKKKKSKEVVGSSFNQPKPAKGQLHKTHVDFSAYPKNILHFNNQFL